MMTGSAAQHSAVQHSAAQCSAAQRSAMVTADLIDDLFLCILVNIKSYHL
jgi:hypothetical protein